jgi:hypothetical protein
MSWDITPGRYIGQNRNKAKRDSSRKSRAMEKSTSLHRPTRSQEANGEKKKHRPVPLRMTG